MSIQNRSYADPTFGDCKELSLGKCAATTNNAAAEIIARHRFFTEVKVLEARGVVQIVGKADTSAMTVYKGTTSIGSIAIGTNTAGSVVDASLTDTDFETTDDLNVGQALATDTGAAFLSFKYQERFA